jgi:hypothetical protein
MTSTQSDFSENYAWVDKRLDELYYSYSLTADNCDEFQDAGLLTENCAWVDDLLQKKFCDEYCDEYYDVGSDDETEIHLCPAPLYWVDYRERCEHMPLEEVLGKRKRSASDKYDYVEDCDDVDDVDLDQTQDFSDIDHIYELDKEYVSIPVLEQSVGYESESSYEDYCDSP